MAQKALNRTGCKNQPSFAHQHTQSGIYKERKEACGCGHEAFECAHDEHGHENLDCARDGHGHENLDCTCDGHGHENLDCACDGHGHENLDCACDGHGHENLDCTCDGHGHGNHGHEAHLHGSHERGTHLHETKGQEGNPPHDNPLKQVYILENLGCANCAAKMERRIQTLPQVEFANIVFATKQLSVVTNTTEELLPIFQEICSSIEAGVTVSKHIRKPAAKAVGTTGVIRGHRKDIAEIGLGAAFLIAGELMKSSGGYVSFVLYLAGYLILGRHVLLVAGGNIIKGHVFDENFLMSIATLGAFAIGEYSEALGVMIFYRVGVLFEEIAVSRSRSQIMDAVDMRPEVVNRFMGDAVEVVPAEDAVVGDILLVRPGDRIPLDGTVVEGKSRIDTSPVTGEPVPVTVSLGDAVVSGCVNTSGLLRIRVDKVLQDSMVTRILDSVENAAASKPKIDRFITRFSRVYTPFVVALAVATALIPSLVTGNWEYWVYTALTFLVISCPCALVLSVPLAFFSGIGAGSKKGILFKGGVAIEALQGVKAIVMDKTGTITEGNFAVQDVIPEAGIGRDELLAMAGSCELNSTHPIGSSIVAAARERAVNMQRPLAVEEISGKGMKVQLDCGNVLCGNRKLLADAQIDVSQYEEASYGTEVLLAFNGKYVGRIVIADTLKQDAKPAIAALKKLGIFTAMLTGDAQGSAQSVADETGIDQVSARLLPENKVEELKRIRDGHGSVMFVGDGINDAPVLAGADVGAAMGSGADAAIEAADVVFMTSSMEAIPESLRIAKITGAIARGNVGLALIIKLLVMAFGMIGMANMWMAVFADTGVAMLCILNSVRVLYKK